MTKEYFISPQFSEKDRQTIEAAVKLSALPEGINIVTNAEIDTATKPFVVVVEKNELSETRRAFLAGADDYVRINPDIESFAGDLSMYVK